MDELEPLPRIDHRGLRRATNFGPPGELRWLPLSQLYIDREYQRAVLERGISNIRKMIEEFSWALFGALVVGKRGPGKYAVIDGQHRAVAALMLDTIDKVPCIVLEGGQKQEAEAFSKINANVTRVHPLQAFRAMVVAGDPDALETVRVCEAADVTMMRNPANSADLKNGETQSLLNIRNAVRVHGAKLVIAAMQLLRAMDPAGGLWDPALRGTIHTLAQHKNWIEDAAERGRKLNRPIAAMVKDAGERKLTYGSTLWHNFAALLTKALERQDAPQARFASEEMRQRAMAGR